MSSEKSIICFACEQEFEKITGKLCVICGRIWEAVPLDNRHGDLCSDCFKWEYSLEAKGSLKMNRSIYKYNEHMKEILASYKFRGDAMIANVFQSSFKEGFNLFYKKEEPLVVPIPLSPERLYERGFNQALLLAELLGEPVADILTKADAPKQSKKGRQERLVRENTFHIVSPEKVKAKKILLVDDIYTTGTTLRMAAKLLRDAGATSISALTLIRS